MIRMVDIEAVRHMFVEYHAYGGASDTATYAFVKLADEVPIAAFAWQPPPPGSAKSVCPEAPAGVLALSRMVAIPKEQRAHMSQASGRHISKPLKKQMRDLIDRTRWPVLVTYSDEGLDHTGHVYKCSGWEPTRRSEVRQYENASGKRCSPYANGHWQRDRLTEIGTAMIQRWENWACPRGTAATWMESHGWIRVPVPGKRWRSGSQAHTWSQRGGQGVLL